MRQVLISFIVICSVLPWPVTGQTIPVNISDKLEKLFAEMKDNNNNDDQRLISNDSVRLIIENYAGSDTVFRHKFTNLKYLGQITSPDNLVKIITWNLILEESSSRYFCYIIRRSALGVEQSIFKLSASYKEMPVSPDTIYSQKNWYGALYYDIRPFISENEISYALLGIDYGNPFITRKLIDILRFNPQNEIIFGRQCFSSDNYLKPRVIFEFASTAVMSLRFRDDRSIVFDHLSPFTPDKKDNYQFYGPDFSYDAYIFENGYWRLKTNIDIRNKD
jgi:hypothetical protein